jgi:uncharacterized protein (TIGR02145 family)
LYDWETAKKACPEGWHLPSRDDWGNLIQTVGSSVVTKLKSKSGWNGTDKYGFAALPCGEGHGGNWENSGSDGYWWSSTKYITSGEPGKNADNVEIIDNYHMSDDYYEDDFVENCEDGICTSGSYQELLSVRCVQDDAEAKAEAKAEEEAKMEPFLKSNGGTFTDARDKKTYKAVKIGEQTWMAENLNYHGEDGFLGLCYGDKPREKIRKPENCKKYGRLYDWNEAMKACPSSWHLPTKEEWQKLSDFAGGDRVAGKKLKAKSGWEIYDFSGKSPKAPKCKWKEEDKIDDRGRTIVGKEEYDKCTTDEYGFAALPGGHYHFHGSFLDAGKAGNWWSASKYDSRGHAYVWGMYYHGEGAGLSDYIERNLYSVRCLQDDMEAEAREKEKKAKAEACDRRIIFDKCVKTGRNPMQCSRDLDKAIQSCRMR